MKRKIEQWLVDGGSYIIGVGLYRAVGGPYPVNYFERYVNARFVPDAVERRLEHALREAANTLPDEPTTTSILVAASAIVEGVGETPAVSAAPEPLPIQSLRTRAKQLHKRQAYVHAQLSTDITQEQRAVFVIEIMEELIPALDAIYDKIRAYQDTGELPTVTTSPNRDRYIIEKMLRRNSLKSRLSRLKSMLKKQMDAVELQKLEKEQLEKQVELKGIEDEFGEYL